jgi:hypothetical protein
LFLVQIMLLTDCLAFLPFRSDFYFPFKRESDLAREKSFLFSPRVKFFLGRRTQKTRDAADTTGHTWARKKEINNAPTGLPEIDVNIYYFKYL